MQKSKVESNMKKLRFVTLLVLVSFAFSGEAYRILSILPYNFESHHIVFERLMTELVERGHQVDVVGHFSPAKPFPKYNVIANLFGTVPDLVNNLTLKEVQTLYASGSDSYITASEYGTELCKLMALPKIKDLINNPPQNPAYDLVITEIYGANCYLAMGQHLGVPVVGVITSLMYPWANDIVANPDNPAYIPNLLLPLSNKMNFWERTKNTLSLLFAKWEFNQVSEEQNDIIKEYMGPQAPSVREAERNVSLILVNSHYSVNGVRPFTAAVVEVGGLHINEKHAVIPDELRQWLDQCDDGFVYVSFGSMMKIESFPEETLAILYASLKKLTPVCVLMKIANPNELPPGLPSNVLTLPWIPQLGVLKHKNIRVFVTHGGLLGIQEAVYYGVPLLGIPLFRDQGQHIRYCTQLKFAVAVDYERISEETLDAAFNAVLHDPSYRNAAKRISLQFRDRPRSPIDTATYGIEYVIKYGGTNLKSPAMDLTWWQNALLDVFGFLLLSVVVALYLIRVAFKRLIKAFHTRIAARKIISKKLK